MFISSSHYREQISDRIIIIDIANNNMILLYHLLIREPVVE